VEREEREIFEREERMSVEREREEREKDEKERKEKEELERRKREKEEGERKTEEREMIEREKEKKERETVERDNLDREERSREDREREEREELERQESERLERDEKEMIKLENEVERVEKKLDASLEKPPASPRDDDQRQRDERRAARVAKVEYITEAILAELASTGGSPQRVDVAPPKTLFDFDDVFGTETASPLPSASSPSSDLKQKAAMDAGAASPSSNAQSSNPSSPLPTDQVAKEDLKMPHSSSPIHRITTGPPPSLRFLNGDMSPSGMLSPSILSPSVTSPSQLMRTIIMRQSPSKLGSVSVMDPLDSISGSLDSMTDELMREKERLSEQIVQSIMGDMLAESLCVAAEAILLKETRRRTIGMYMASCVCAYMPSNAHMFCKFVILMHLKFSILIFIRRMHTFPQSLCQRKPVRRLLHQSQLQRFLQSPSQRNSPLMFALPSTVIAHCRTSLL
jgi:hypothetical protein